jgi:hypothetical protein
VFCGWTSVLFSIQIFPAELLIFSSGTPRGLVVMFGWEKWVILLWNGCCKQPPHCLGKHSQDISCVIVILSPILPALESPEQSMGTVALFTPFSM